MATKKATPKRNQYAPHVERIYAHVHKVTRALGEVYRHRSRAREEKPADHVVVPGRFVPDKLQGR